MAFGSSASIAWPGDTALPERSFEDNCVPKQELGNEKKTRAKRTGKPKAQGPKSQGIPKSEMGKSSNESRGNARQIDPTDFAVLGISPKAVYSPMDESVRLADLGFGFWDLGFRLRLIRAKAISAPPIQVAGSGIAVGTSSMSLDV